jgi:hypothetical protein
MSERKKPENGMEPLVWPAPVLRVALHWSGGSWSIAGTTRVASMTLPRTDALVAGEQTAGFWIEAVDREGRVRYRRIMPDPLSGMETFGRAGGITRIPHTGHDVDVEVLVPDLPDVTELHIVSNPALQGEHAHSHREVLELQRAEGSDSSTLDEGDADHPPMT